MWLWHTKLRWRASERNEKGAPVVAHEVEVQRPSRGEAAVVLLALDGRRQGARVDAVVSVAVQEEPLAVQLEAPAIDLEALDAEALRLPVEQRARRAAGTQLDMRRVHRRLIRRPEQRILHGDGGCRALPTAAARISRADNPTRRLAFVDNAQMRRRGSAGTDLNGYIERRRIQLRSHDLVPDVRRLDPALRRPSLQRHVTIRPSPLENSDRSEFLAQRVAILRAPRMRGCLSDH